MTRFGRSGGAGGAGTAFCCRRRCGETRHFSKPWTRERPAWHPRPRLLARAGSGPAWSSVIPSACFLTVLWFTGAPAVLFHSLGLHLNRKPKRGVWLGRSCLGRCKSTPVHHRGLTVMLGFFRMVFHHLLSGYYMPGRLSPSSLQTRNSDTQK